MKIKSQLFFDLDGTLCDSLEGIQKGLQHALKENKQPELSAETLKEMIGIPLRESLKRFVFPSEDFDSELYENTIDSFRLYYAQIGVYESQLYSDIPKIIKELQLRAELFVITAKPKELAVEMLKFHGLFDYFSGVGGFNGQSHFSKADLIETFRDNKQAYMIGDKSEDILAGKAHGIHTIAALYGYGSKEELEAVTPDLFIETPQKLMSIL